MKIRDLVVRFGLWIASLGGWTPPPPCARTHAPDETAVELAREVVADVGRRFAGASGTYRRREALRVLMARSPETPERMLNYLIEAALQ